MHSLFIYLIIQGKSKMKKFVQGLTSILIVLSYASSCYSSLSSRMMECEHSRASINIVFSRTYVLTQSKSKVMECLHSPASIRAKSCIYAHSLPMYLINQGNNSKLMNLVQSLTFMTCFFILGNSEMTHCEQKSCVCAHSLRICLHSGQEPDDEMCTELVCAGKSWLCVASSKGVAR